MLKNSKIECNWIFQIVIGYYNWIFLISVVLSLMFFVFVFAVVVGLLGFFGVFFVFVFFFGARGNRRKIFSESLPVYMGYSMTILVYEYTIHCQFMTIHEH